LTFVGLFFAHYRVFVFGVLLAATLWLWAMWRPHPPQSRARLLGETVVVMLLGLLLLTPWLWRLAQGFGGSFATTMVSGYEQEQYGAYYGFDPKELVNFGMYAPLWGAALGAALWGVWRRNGVVIVMLAWVAGCFTGANLHYLNFTPLYSNTIVILALYLPLAVLIGYGAGEVLTWIVARWPQSNRAQRALVVGWLLLILLLGGYALQRDARLVERENVFVRAGDLAAMTWVEREIPTDALFFIATTFWTPEVAHGLDGGYFLPLLAGRQTIMPPQHYASDGSAEYRVFINERLRALHAARDVDALWAAMQLYGITHLYIGVRPSGLDPAYFAGRPDLFLPLYAVEGVTIFQVVSP
jgi:hypothetical protein